MNATENKRAVVLFAHGSRDPLWHKPMEAVAKTLASAEPDLSVRCAYLEISQPDLATACNALADAGIHHIKVIPMFLGVGRHAREDLPLLVKELREKLPGVTFELKPAVGEDPRLIQLLAGIAAE
jgi:sirohydrochlorin cobaltochelatase